MPETILLLDVADDSPQANRFRYWESVVDEALQATRADRQRCSGRRTYHNGRIRRGNLNASGLEVAAEAVLREDLTLRLHRATIYVLRAEKTLIYNLALRYMRNKALGIPQDEIFECKLSPHVYIEAAALI